ncbi:MAG: hypothetical protein IIB56_18055 [Planctomycetes bacterium]|nr:hypothetical protein [Planctomycetota bacterium]
MRVTDVLEKNHLAAGAIGGKAAVGVFGERGRAVPGRQHCFERRFGLRRGEFQNFRPRRTTVGVRVGHERWINRHKQASVGKTRERTRLPSTAHLIDLHLLPAAGVPPKEHPATIVQRLKVLKRFNAARKNILADTHQTR